MSTSGTTTRPGPAPARALYVLLAGVCGLSVASVYYAQPLLDEIAASFGVGEGSIGLVVTLTQVGYAIGLLLIVPLGDMVEPRRLILALLSLSVLALLAVAAAPSIAVLLGAVLLVGLLAVVIQVIVAFAATLAAPGAAGAAVGTVTSGVVIGILLARTFAGAVAEVASWRTVYLASSLLILLALGLLSRRLPAISRTEPAVGYAGLLRSLAALYRDQRLLRVRGGLALLSFGAFSIVWSSLSLELGSPPLSLSPAAIGAFGLVGAAGALAASRAGRLVDRGFGERTTGIALILMLSAWLALALLEQSLLALAIGLVLIDLGLQAIHVTSQAMLYATAPTSRSRMAGAYMFFYSAGSALGAIASTATYSAGGWTAVCTLGAATSLTALGFWAKTRQPHTGWLPSWIAGNLTARIEPAPPHSQAESPQRARQDSNL